MAEDLAAAIAAAASERGEEPVFMPSGAGHDAMVLGRFVPALQLSRLLPATGAVPRDIPGTPGRLTVAALTVAVAVATGALVLSFSGSWTSGPWR